MTTSGTITIKGRNYVLKDLVAVSRFTDRGDIIGFRVANGEDNADDYGVAPGEQGYVELDTLRVKYYELEWINEKQQLLYNIMCDALIQKESLSPVLLRILVNNIGVRGWECKELIEPFRGWAQIVQLPEDEVNNVVFELELAL
jgi:hypothetical protein